MRKIFLFITSQRCLESSLRRERLKISIADEGGVRIEAALNRSV